MVFKKLCILVLWAKIVSASEGLNVVVDKGLNYYIESPPLAPPMISQRHQLHIRREETIMLSYHGLGASLVSSKKPWLGGHAGLLVLCLRVVHCWMITLTVGAECLNPNGD